MNRYLETPFTKEKMKDLEAGDYVYITGTIYTARDAAHKRMYEALHNGEELPLDLRDNLIYYMGPSPARDKRPIGSAGPTTSSRMDKYAPDLLELGQAGMIGKGKRNQEVKDSLVKNGAVYFAAIGGAGALYSKCVEECRVIAFEDLGCESVKELKIKDFPLLVAIDSKGNSLYK